MNICFVTCGKFLDQVRCEGFYGVKQLRAASLSKEVLSQSRSAWCRFGSVFAARSVL